MFEDRESPATLLPHGMPEGPYPRLLLFAIRRMAAGGLNDAHAAHALFTGFGLGFRRPLILVRALMAELARVSAVKIAVAPCCCPRMTTAESTLIAAITSANGAPEATHDRLAAMLHVRSCLGVVTSAQAVATSFADGGMPLAA